MSSINSFSLKQPSSTNNNTFKPVTISQPSQQRTASPLNSLNSGLNLNQNTFKPKTIQQPQVQSLDKSLLAKNYFGDNYEKTVGGDDAFATGMAGTIFSPVMKGQTGYNKQWDQGTGEYHSDPNIISQNYQNFTYKNLLENYNNASDTDRAEVKAGIDRAKIKWESEFENGNQEASKYISLLNQLSNSIDKYGNNASKDLGQQIKDYATTGGYVGTLYNQLLSP